MLKISQVRAPRVHNKAPLADRMAYRIDGSGGADACWPWTGVIDPKGYGHLRDQGRWLLAHRVAYTLMRGPIPDGMQLDHLCHTRDVACQAARQCFHRRCVNPAHLEPVSLRENRRRGRPALIRQGRSGQPSARQP